MAGQRREDLVYVFLKVVLSIFYRIFFRLKAYSVEEIPSEAESRGVILASNHASYLDPPAVGVATPRRVTFLAKDYLFQKAVVGWTLRAVGAFRIKSRVGDFKSIRDLIRILQEGRCVLIFPEGTRSEDGELKEAEPGVGFIAAKSNCWVVPVYIEGSYHAFPKGSAWFKPHPLNVHFGKAFVPSEDPELMSSPNPYEDVSRKIMAEIANLKRKVLAR